MKWIFIVCLIIVCNPNAQAQTRRVRTFILYPTPDWDTSLSGAVQKQLVESDSVYFYKKLKNNHDSALVAVLYFDSLGNLAERDDFNFSTHQIKTVINYTYTDNQLTKEEALSQTNFIVNGNNSMERTIRTFDYDSAGNIVTEKAYNFFGDSLKKLSITTKSREYDNLGNITKEYVALPNHDPYLHRTFEYTDGKLSEEKTYDFHQQWIYSYIYEYDDRAKTKDVYLQNESKHLQNEYLYDSQKRIIKEKIYSKRDIYWDYSANEYNYKSNGLLASQTFNTVNNDIFVFRHFYSKRK